MTEYSEAEDTAAEGSEQRAGSGAGSGAASGAASGAGSGAASKDQGPPAQSADAVLQLARELLEQNRSDEALAVIAQYATSTSSSLPSAGLESKPVFEDGVSDRELEFAFEAAESDREQMLDADEIAERAIRQTDPRIDRLEEIPFVQEDFVSSDSSYATRTVAKLVERQGDGPTASRIRSFVDSFDQNPAEQSSLVESKPLVRDRRTATIMELERWLVNLRGVAQ